MPPLDQDSQFRFLIACIKHCTSPGKVDFTAVADEVGIVSKGAAAKRYERLMKAHGLPGIGGVRANTSSAQPTTAPKRTQRAGKKRTRAATMDDGQDDEEDIKPKRDKTIKDEVNEVDGPSIPLASMPTLGSTAAAAEDDDDVLIVHATERVDNGAAAPAMTAPTYDFHANNGFPVQTPMMGTRPSTGGADLGAGDAWFHASHGDPGSYLCAWNEPHGVSEDVENA